MNPQSILKKDSRNRAKSRITQSYHFPTIYWDTLWEKKYEELSFNCPWTIFVSENNKKFLITYIRWTWTYGFKICIHFERYDLPDKKYQRQIYKNTFLYASLAASLISYEHQPERYITKFDLDVLGELTSVMDIECVTSPKYNQLYTDLIKFYDL